jgi:transposase
MKVLAAVIVVWKRMPKSARRQLSSAAMRCQDAGRMARCKIILNLTRGRSPTEIMRFSQCSRSQVYRIAERFIAGGLAGLEDGRADNGPRKVDEEFELQALIAVAFSPQEYGFRRPTWTLELLVLSLAEKTQVRISCSTMSRLLKRHRARRGRPKPIVGCPWSKHRKSRRLNAIRRMIDNLPRGEVVLYVDEVDVHLNPKIGVDWMLEGQQKQVLTPGKNVKRYLAGALNPLTGHIVYVEGERKTGHLFLALLKELLSRYRGFRRIHIVLDNYKIHTAKYVQAAIGEWGGRLTFHFLPPYCPDHNRIERLWKDLHDNVTRNHRCPTIQDLLHEVREYLHVRQCHHRHQYATAA